MIENKYKPYKYKYKKYIQSKRWKLIKKRHYLKDENKTCKFCNLSDNLHVHHLMYIDRKGNSLLGKEPSNKLITLCRKCHNELHRHLKEGKTIHSLGTVEYYRRKRII